MALLVLLNNFLHDFSAAGWLFGTVLLWCLFRKHFPDNDADKVTIEIFKTILFLMKLSLVGIIAFGLLRTVAYKTYEWSQAAGRDQITLLIVKHVIFTIIFIPGLVLYIRAGKCIRRSENEKIE